MGLRITYNDKHSPGMGMVRATLDGREALAYYSVGEDGKPTSSRESVRQAALKRLAGDKPNWSIIQT